MIGVFSILLILLEPHFDSFAWRLAACARMNDIRLNIGKIQDMIKPILEKLVNDDKDGLFDQVAVPLKQLVTPLPGISDMTGQDVTFLVRFILCLHSSSVLLLSEPHHEVYLLQDIAETFVPESQKG